MWFIESFKNLNKFEKSWLSAFSAIIMLTTFYFSGTATDYTSWWSVLLNWVISPVSAITGVVCVVLCARGVKWNYIWGIVNSITYGIVAWVSGYYGDALLNIFFFLPTQIFILLMWKKNIDGDGIVTMKRLGPWARTLLAFGTLLAIGVFTVFLMGFDNFISQAFKRNSAFYANLDAVTGLPFLGPVMDATTVILQIVAEVLLIFMYAEQWPLWIAVNVITSLIWGIVIWTDPTSVGYAVPTLVMWLAFLVNSVYGMIVWYRNSRTGVQELKAWMNALHK